MGKSNGTTRASSSSSPRGVSPTSASLSSAQERREIRNRSISIVNSYLKNDRDWEKNYDYEVSANKLNGHIEVKLHSASGEQATEIADAIQRRLENAKISSPLLGYDYSDVERKITFYPDYPVTREEMKKVRLR